MMLIKRQTMWFFSCLALISLSFYGIKIIRQSKAEETMTRTTELPPLTTNLGNTSNNAPTNEALTLQGQSLPYFTITNLEGEIVASSDFYDKPIFVMEWASWCRYCQQQMPIIQALYEKYGDRVNFVLINATGFNGETPEAAQKYMTQNGYTIPWYNDPGMATAAILKMQSTPTSYIIDRNQIIQRVFPFVQSEKILTTVIESTLN